MGIIHGDDEDISGLISAMKVVEIKGRAEAGNRGFSDRRVTFRQCRHGPDTGQRRGVQ